jgi:hypothetical protein
MSDIASELHGTARLQVALARMEGHKIDKRLMRFDDLVETALQYGRISEVFDADTARWALRDEVIGSCVIGDRDYTGLPPIDYRWMASSHE